MIYPEYSEMLEQLEKEPNFFLSSEYWERAGWYDSSCDEVSFVGAPLLERFFDHQFIYEPINPDNIDEFLSGKQMKSVRKQYNKYRDILTPFYNTQDDPEDLLMKWVGERDLYDPDVFVNYVFHGDNRIFIKNQKGELVALLIWDYNYKFINFRYCLVDPDYKGLSDYCRVLFRQLMYLRFPTKLINDGGSLGSPTLYTYKQKLKPLKVDLLYYKSNKD